MTSAPMVVTRAGVRTMKDDTPHPTIGGLPDQITLVGWMSEGGDSATE